MDITSSIKNSLLTAIVVGTSTTAAYASAELGDAKVIQADSNGFEATVTLKNQPLKEIGSVDLTKNASVVDANLQASSQLFISLDKAVDGSENTHVVRIKGPGKIATEHLAFNVQISRMDGSKLVKSYDLPSSMQSANTTVSAAPVSNHAVMVAQNDVKADYPKEVLAIMSDFEEVAGVTVLPTQGLDEAQAVAKADVQESMPAAVASIDKEKTAVSSAKNTTIDTRISVGEVVALSNMGERLALEFDVFGGNIENASDLQINIAPDTSLGALSPDAASVIAMLEQNVEPKGNGRYSVKLTSNQVMNEPLIPLLIDVKVGAKEESRRYSVFMDPPKAGAPSFQPEATFVADNGDFILVDKPVKAKSAVRKPVLVAKAAGNYGKATSNYLVSEGETLAGIAANLKGRAPLAEKMQHILSANPNAFVNGDVNRIIAGTTLKLPATWKQISPEPNMAPTKQTELAFAEDATSPVEEVLAQSQSTGQLEIPNMLPESEQLIGDEAIVNEVTSPNAPVQVAKTETQAPIAAPIVESEESLLDNTDTLALGAGVAAAAMAAGGIVLLRRRKAKAQDDFYLEEDALDLGEDDIDGLLTNNDALSFDDVNYISEADAYVNRGQINQAILVLKSGFEEQSANTAILVRLFELLSLKGDSVEFNSIATGYASLLKQDKALLSRANELAQSMSPVPELFQGMATRGDDSEALLQEPSVG